MKKILKLSLLLFFFTFVTACASSIVCFPHDCRDNRLDIKSMPKPPKSGPPEYIEGWEDGCQTGMGAYSSDYLRARYGTAVKGYMMKNSYYNKGWELGQRYCSYYVSTYLSNKEFFSNDLRTSNAWVSLRSDGFFDYGGWTKLGW